MSTQHSKAAKEFLKNQQYAHWHDSTFWSVRTKRDKMAYGLEEWEQLREKASQIKRHTITHLDEYLEQFATKAEENGCIVHWAKDANEFNEIVYGILKEAESLPKPLPRRGCLKCDVGFRILSPRRGCLKCNSPKMYNN